MARVRKFRLAAAGGFALCLAAYAPAARAQELDALTIAIRAPDPAARAAAYRSLAQLAGRKPRALDALLSGLDDPAEAPREAARAGLRLAARHSPRAAALLEGFPGTRTPEIIVEVDSRLELLAAVAALAEPGRRDPPSCGPPVDREALAPLAGHPAVARLAGRLKRGGTLSAIAGLLIRSSPLPELARLDGGAASLGSSEDDGALLVELKDFAARADWTRRFADRASGYAPCLARAREALAGLAEPAEAAEYMGLPFPHRRARILLAPDLARPGPGLLALWGEAPGLELLHAPEPSLRRELVLGDPIGNSTVHQLAHAALDDAVDRLAEGPPETGPLPCDGRLGTGWNCLKEQLVVAVLLRVELRRAGEAAYAALLRDRPSPPLVLLDQLARYESARGRYPTLAAFLPEILAALRAAPSSPD